MLSSFPKYICCLLSGLLLTSSAYAEDQSDQPTKYSPPGIRSPVVTEYLFCQEECHDECQGCEKNEDQSEHDSDLLRNELPQLGNVEAIKKTLPIDPPHMGVYYTTHRGAYHQPIAITPYGEIVELEDNSRWAISPADSYKVLNWLVTDLLVITINHDWFSDCFFRITNQMTGVSVRANLNLFLNPVYHSAYNHRIVAIDDLLQQIWLEDGSMWSIESSDYSIKWQLNDTIIIGINDGWRSTTRPNVLINCNDIFHPSRASCIY